MTILVGADLPGLLSALEPLLGRAPVVAPDAATLLRQISDPAVRIDALVVRDTIAPLPRQDVASSLWALAAALRRCRAAGAPLLLLLDPATPAVIRDALQAEARAIGGDVCLLPAYARTPDHPEVRAALDWLRDQLQPLARRRRYALVTANCAGGTGKTSTLLHLALQLRQRGLRVLAVDLDIAQGGLGGWLRVATEPDMGFTTIPDLDHPTPDTVALVTRRIVHLPGGLDVLLSGQGMHDQHDCSTAELEGLIDTIARLDYDVVCYDMPGDWKRRPVIVSLLTRPDVAPLVICPAARAGRAGALAALAVLDQIPRADGHSALEDAHVLFIAGERGTAGSIGAARQELLRRCPNLTDLGTLPRDPALLSLAAEQSAFCSAFDLAPRLAYCRAIRTAAARWIESVGLPPAWLAAPDPDARRPLLARLAGWPGRVSVLAAAPLHDEVLV